jgi:hypothetical protein
VLLHLLETPFFYRHNGEIASFWMLNSSESMSPAGAASGSFPGFSGGSGGYVPSNVYMLSDRFSSSPSSTLRTRARAARCGGAGRSKARRSSSPVPRHVRFGPFPRASKRIDPKADKRAMPYLNLCVLCAKFQELKCALMEFKFNFPAFNEVGRFRTSPFCLRLS